MPLARRAETERSLRDITARIAALTRPRRGARARRRGREASARDGWRAPDPDGSDRHLPHPRRRRRRGRRCHTGMAAGHEVPARRRASTASPPRVASPSGPSTTSPTLASRTSPTTTRVAERLGLRGHGRRPTARAGWRGHRHARDLDGGTAHLRGGRPRPPPGSGRPGRDRADELEPPRPPDPRGGPLPGPGPDDAGRDLAGRSRGLLHLHGRIRPRACSAGRSTRSSGSTSPS